MIDITLTGWLFIPLSIAAAIWLPRHLLGWTLFCAMWQAAAVVTVPLGDRVIGLQPGFFAAAVFVVSDAVRGRWAQQGELDKKIAWASMPLAIYGGLAILSAVALPTIFAGSVEIMPPHGGISEANVAPLGLSNSNLSAIVYMGGLGIFAIVAMRHVARRETSIQILAGWVIGSVAAVVGFAAYQVVAWHANLPYPTDFIHSNPGYAHLFHQTIGGMKRASSILTEPSRAAYVLTGLMAFVLWRFVQEGRRKYAPAVGITFIGILLTISTTGYVAGGVVAGTIVAWAFIRPGSARSRLHGSLAITFGLACLFSIAALFDESFSDAMKAILFEKTGTSSFSDRSFSAWLSIKNLAPTFGLGTGLGSTRTSGIWSNLVGNLGVWGFGLAVWWGVRMYELRRLSTEREPAFVALMFGLLAGASLATPDLNELVLWTTVAIIMGVWLRAPEPPAVDPLQAKLAGPVSE